CRWGRQVALRPRAGNSISAGHSRAWTCSPVAWIAQTAAAIMRNGLARVLLSLPLALVACAAPGADDGPTPYDEEYGITFGDINEGAPDNDTLPDDNKADAIYPA